MAKLVVLRCHIIFPLFSRPNLCTELTRLLRCRISRARRRRTFTRATIAHGSCSLSIGWLDCGVLRSFTTLHSTPLPIESTTLSEAKRITQILMQTGVPKSVGIQKRRRRKQEGAMEWNTLDSRGIRGVQSGKDHERLQGEWDMRVESTGGDAQVATCDGSIIPQSVGSFFMEIKRRFVDLCRRTNKYHFVSINNL